jgi:hypothetical protein
MSSIRHSKIPALASVFAAMILISSSAHAGDTASATSNASMAAPDSRYGWFGLLDHRSGYGLGVFPEPFLVDDSDLEPNEFRLDWLHTKAGGTHSDMFKAEIEKSFGIVTFELEVPFERDRDGAAGQTTKGFDNVDVGARLPIYQFVSNSGFIDNTIGLGIEAGIPTNSKVSKNTELVPKVFDDLRLGTHFTVQSVLGYSQLFGSGDEGGLASFEYGFVFGYTIHNKELPIPGVQQIIPVFELSGETQVNKDDPGHNSLVGNAAIRVNLDAIGPVQPRLGVGFVFPIDRGAREDVHAGIYTSMVFEY